MNETSSDRVALRGGEQAGRADVTASEDLLGPLHRHFGFRAFLEGQEGAVRSVLDGGDVVVIMPTGSGKSLCYQLAAMLVDGVTLVVSPLIALMKDQVDGLVARGLPATFINSSLSADEMRERLRGLRKGSYRMVYVAPERFQNESFRETLSGLRVALFAVDEAHCISQWGHDFRPDYLRMREALRAWPAARVMALTATATPDVRTDIVRQLGLGLNGRPEPTVSVFGFERPNLHLAVARTPTHADKLARVEAAVEKWKTGIVYCATRRQVETVAGYLRRAGRPCVLYHGGLADDERAQIQDRFMTGAVPVVVATNAFGMGVDRADLRFVLHWDIPGSIEAYYQEVGRAGRDGEEALCELLYNYADVRTQEFFLEGSNPSREVVLEVWNAVRRACLHGPVSRPISAWTAEVAGTRNDMSVRTALYVLQQAGLIRRTAEPGTRTYSTALVEGAEVAVVEQQFVHLAEKRRRDERKLKTILRYVEAPACRHRFILHYFGETRDAPRCRACDNCAALADTNRRPPTEEEWVVLQKVLSCVARMKGRFGRGRVAQVLVGSKAKPILDLQLDRLSTYDLLGDAGENYVRSVLDELIRDGSIEVAPGEYPTVAITARGQEVMWRKVAIEMVWPEPARKRAARVREKAAGSDPGDLDDEEAGPVDPDLLNRLRAWRTREAKVRKVPAYVILHDRTLRGIAAAQPESYADLEQVRGMGPSKVAQFGESLLQIVDTQG